MTSSGNHAIFFYWMSPLRRQFFF